VDSSLIEAALSCGFADVFEMDAMNEQHAPHDCDAVSCCDDVKWKDAPTHAPRARAQRKIAGVFSFLRMI